MLHVHPVGRAAWYVPLVAERHEHVPVPAPFTDVLQRGEVRGGVTKVDVLVDDPVHHQHPTRHVSAPGERRRLPVPVRVTLRRAHVPLGVVRVVPLPSRHGCPGDGAREHLGTPRERQRGEETPVTPPENSHSTWIDQPFPHQILNSERLVLNLARAEVTHDGALEKLTAARAAPVVQLEHHHPARAVALRPDVGGEMPRVLNRLRVGAAVDAHDARVRRRAVCVGVGDVHRTVQGGDVVRGGDFEQRRRRESHEPLRQILGVHNFLKVKNRSRDAARLIRGRVTGFVNLHGRCLIQRAVHAHVPLAPVVHGARVPPVFSRQTRD